MVFFHWALLFGSNLCCCCCSIGALTVDNTVANTALRHGTDGFKKAVTWKDRRVYSDVVRKARLAESQVQMAKIQQGPGGDRAHVLSLSAVHMERDERSRLR